MRREVSALGKLTSAPAVHDTQEKDGLRSFFFDSVPYRGKPTRVFAWYGTSSKQSGKVPAMVLVHGGGGSAFPEWVRKWNEHGFAAISIAVEGQTSEREGKEWKRHEWGGPARNGIYGDSNEPLRDQWMYHAVAATVLATSLLRSFPEVDAERVGVMGISWGGVITATVMGIDTRFAFAIPTYGCGALADAENQYGRALGNNDLYRKVWDPVLYLPNARVPALWFTWLHDVHFPLTAQSASYRAAPGPRTIAVLPDMKHSHSRGWNPPDSYAFAKEPRWLTMRSQSRKGDTATAEFSSTRPIDKAMVFSTSGSGFTGTREWVQTECTTQARGQTIIVTCKLPQGARAWFINVRSGELTGSSDFQEESSR